MGGASSFYAMLAITGFLTCLWMAGKMARRIHVSSMVLEVAVGVVLGPQVLQLIPHELAEPFTGQVVDCDKYKYQLKTANKGYKYCDLDAYLTEDKYIGGGLTAQNWDGGFFKAGTHEGGKVVIDGVKGGTFCLDPNNQASCARRLGATPRQLKDKKGKAEYDTYKECLIKSCKLDVAIESALVPDIFTLVGHTGVAMMIFESGLHFDFEQAKTVGPWACAVAILGTFLPLLSGAGLAYAFAKISNAEYEFFPDCLSAGVALAPTSVGIALKLLHEAKALQEYFGQAVMTAAFVDDVLSLILFSVLFSIGDDMTFMDFFPLLMGCTFMVLAIIAAVKVWPPFIEWFLSKIPEQKPQAKVTTHDEAMWFLMFVTLCAYGQITHVCGTHLWGAFIGGMSFATNHHAAHVWVKQVKRITCWFLRIFFGCTLAWSIPVSELFSIEAFWQGSLMGIGPCIASKVLCAPFMGQSRWVIGWAMVGRAEFAYFIAILAKSVNMMHEKLFAILVWALLYATIFAPLIFRKVLHKYMASIGKDYEMKDLAMAMSGHLPDIEAELEEEERELMQEKVEVLTKELKQKENDIVEFQRQISSASQAKAFAPEFEEEWKKLEADEKQQEVEEIQKPEENVETKTTRIDIEEYQLLALASQAAAYSQEFEGIKKPDEPEEIQEPDQNALNKGTRIDI